MNIIRHTHIDNHILTKKGVLFFVLFSMGYLTIADSILSSVIEKYKTGETFMYSTKGLEKAEGLNMSMSIPTDFKEAAGKHEHVLTQFSLLLNNESFSINILVDNIENEVAQYGLTDSEIINTFFSETELSRKRNVLYYEPTKYDGCEGVFCVGSETRSRAGVTICLLQTQHIFVYRNRLCVCTIGYSNFSEIDFYKKIQLFTVLSSIIGNSIIVNKR